MILASETFKFNVIQTSAAQNVVTDQRWSMDFVLLIGEKYKNWE